MENKKGFTLVELIAVISLLALLMVLLVPQIQKVSYNSRVKLCNTKMDVTTNALSLWFINNSQCFFESDGCDILSDCLTDNNITNCKTTFKKIAQNGIIEYDKNNDVINPLGDVNINDNEIIINYNSKNNITDINIDIDGICANSKVEPETSTTTTKKVDTNIQLKTYIEYLSKVATQATIEGLSTDDYNNIRYVGASPKNYISFNNETWRIIGIVDGYVKIIREASIGDYQWTNSDANDWTIASLQTYLNGDYYNSLSEVAQNQIVTVTWNLGGWDTPSVSAAVMYTYERGETVYSGRPTTWSGKIALMYPSDYGFASTDSTCLGNLYNCGNDTNKAGNWLYISKGTGSSNYYEWILSQDSFFPSNVFHVNSSGRVNGNYHVNNSFAVRPVLHLKNTVLRVSGDGTSSNPYILS